MSGDEKTNIINIAIGFALVVILMLAVLQTSSARGNDRPPNIVVFMADDFTYRDIGCYGSADSRTPRIDEFAREGMRFNRCYQAVAMCSPTRSNLMTGLYPVKSGAYPNHSYVREGTQSIVQLLSPLNYRSALLGKRHIGPESSFPFEYLGNTPDEIDFSRMDELLKSANDQRDPFLLFVCSYQPHLPYTKGKPDEFDPQAISLPANMVDTRETREEYVKYLAEVQYLDQEFGQCLDLLDKYNLAENTIVLFTSEHGHSFPFAKWTSYSDGLRSALIVRWPGRIGRDSESDAIVEYTDIVPTLMDFAGLTPPSTLDGRSFRRVLEGKSKRHKKYAYGIQTTRGINQGPEYYGIRTVCDDSYRYILNLTPEVRFQNNITMDPDKNQIFQSWLQAAESDSRARQLVHRYQFRPSEELYDLVNDPFELVNLADDPSYSRIRKRLHRQLIRWMDTQGDRGQATELETEQHISKK